MENEKLIPILEKNLERMVGWVRASEGRLALVLPLSTSMLAASSTILGLQGWHAYYFVICIFLAIIPLLLSLLFSFFALVPRVKGNGQSLIYFGDVHMLPLEAYRVKMLDLTEEDYLSDLLSQFLINAKIAHEKYKWMSWSMTCLIFSSFPWVISVFYFLRLQYGAP